MSSQTVKEQELESHLQSLGTVHQEEEAQQRAASLGLTYSDGTKLPLDTTAMKLLSKEAWLKAGMVVVFSEGTGVVVAAVDPSSPEAQALLAQLKQTHETVRVVVVSNSTFTSLIAQYPTSSNAPIATSGVIAVSTTATGRTLGAIGELAGTLQGLSASDAMEQLLLGALALKASDIHLEPETGATRIRVRVDGFLHDAGALESTQAHHLVDRIKILSGTKLNITKAPQDGRFTIQQPDVAMEVRVSLLPSEYGESIVMRLLDPRSITVTLDKQGMPPRVLETVLKALAQPQGSVIATGPTGSGKTTTLYALIKLLNTPNTSIITIEDPIEYSIEGINQMGVNAKTGLTFANGLRSILRQDPNVIMVGEIRDEETASLVINAALTGHVVLSTIHTNSAVGVIPRLIDMGVRPFLIPSTLRAVIAQRLIRTLCPRCRKKISPNDKIKKLYFRNLKDYALVCQKRSEAYQSLVYL
jgi:type IV pilus assembly protein PilB